MAAASVRLLLVMMVPTAVGAVDWNRVAETSVVEVVTDDEDGARRQTKVWIVALDGQGYIRTNDSRWLANIRRGSPVALRAGGEEFAVEARETSDAAVAARVEEAFKRKYGFVQKLMSLFRFSEPTVLGLTGK